jgi:NAD+-dependent protein deacetylase SIR2
VLNVFAGSTECGIPVALKDISISFATLVSLKGLYFLLSLLSSAFARIIPVLLKKTLNPKMRRTDKRLNNLPNCKSKEISSKCLSNLKNNTRSKVIQKIQTSSRQLYITGAGISAGSGIPCFRTGKQLVKYGKFTLKELLNVQTSPEGAKAQLQMLGQLKQTMMNAQGSSTHAFLAKLKSMGKLLRVYTQNVDALELTVGLTIGTDESDSVRQLHGTMQTVRCTQCHTEAEFDSELMDSMKLGLITKCQHCEKRATEMKSRRAKPLIGYWFPSFVLYGSPVFGEEDIVNCFNADMKKLRNNDLVVVMVGKY